MNCFCFVQTQLKTRLKQAVRISKLAPTVVDTATVADKALMLMDSLLEVSSVASSTVVVI